MKKGDNEYVSIDKEGWVREMSQLEKKSEAFARTTKTIDSQAPSVYVFAKIEDEEKTFFDGKYLKSLSRKSNLVKSYSPFRITFLQKKNFVAEELAGA